MTFSYFVYYGFGINNNKDNKAVGTASSMSEVISSDVDWGLGSVDNISVASGQIGLDNKNESTYLLSDYYSSHPENFSTCALSSMSTAFDTNLDTYMGAAIWEGTCDPDPWIKIDLGESKHFGTVYSKSQVIDISYTENGVDYTYFGQCISCDALNVVAWDMLSHPSAQYIRIKGAGWSIFEVWFTTNATATHTSAATQIDGSEGGTKNFVEWETFTPTYTEPANTNVKFRFRTSADASTWTSWSSYQTPASGGAFDISAIVDSGSGANKYLQVETTLENTDGVSTPTVDSYSTGYHTNLAPSTPTNLTAVVGE